MAATESKNSESKWKWEDTALRYTLSKELSVDDLKLLLSTRGERKSGWRMRQNKINLELHLIRSYNVELTQPLENLTNRELIAELRLRRLNDRSAKKSILIQRLKV